ncbi:MAG: adenylate/guanylate cyclase domain-containing protein [Alphaproteobacteria bacterium]|nr:adenylate/guanylate cyclase domain-containing protein [Alphaproteobacteria bacterium]
MSNYLIQNLRLGTGLVIFFYLISHFLNHTLGLFSLDAMEAGRVIFITFWRNPIITTILYGSFFIHAVLALWSLYRRNTLRMPLWEIIQLGTGLFIPPLLLIHILATRVAHQIFGLQDLYSYVLMSLWVWEPWIGVQQIVVMITAWIHGCIGIHFWLRMKSFYSNISKFFYSLALLLPIFSLLGFITAGREVERLMQNPDWFGAQAVLIKLPTAEQISIIHNFFVRGQIGFVSLVILVLVARLCRFLILRQNYITITYPDDRKAVIQKGMSILEASRLHNIPHASICGGRGRCSTCRVQILSPLENIPPPSLEEQKVLNRIKAGPNVRLACQIKPIENVSVIPLLPPTIMPKDSYKKAYLHGREEEIAVLFADLRAFTKLSEHKLPYDIVFLLNKYFRAMGTAIEQAGGHVDKFIGDGVMALFGIGQTPQIASKQAIEAAKQMVKNLESLNESLAHDLPEPLRIGIGIHIGPVVIGEMGHAHAVSTTAIGDTVNTASRLEGLTKDFSCQLILSENMVHYSTLDTSQLQSHTLQIRGKQDPLIVFIVSDIHELDSKIIKN